MIFFTNLRDEEEDLDDDSDVGLNDDVLAEIGEDVEDVADDTEGFGLIEEEKEDEPEKEKTADDDDDSDSLEADAEDVDYDTFDDIDEM
jgi:hypothetical protein